MALRQFRLSSPLRPGPFFSSTSSSPLLPYRLTVLMAASINLLLLSLPVLLLLLHHPTMSTATLPPGFTTLKNSYGQITAQVQNVCWVGYRAYLLLRFLTISWGIFPPLQYYRPIDASFRFNPSQQGPSLGYYVEFECYKLHGGWYRIGLAFKIPGLQEMEIQNVDSHSIIITMFEKISN
ncbi:hypothetical protein AXF42_Ash010990 [Apostasia shenzhenica]|uniref:Uncharacterized protein n=1 Tax=Apostasia shenzhenica TaxID=1088818 RepID=A0A2H9ZQT1_9ASPA|nr:hypothetical protein AXF42_Ash010990 [Apostasia shenzhenica]